MYNTSVSQTVDVNNLMCIYNSYSFIRNIGMNMIINDNITLKNLLNVSDIIIAFICQNVLYVNPNLNQIYERLISYKILN